MKKHELLCCIHVPSQSSKQLSGFQPHANETFVISEHVKPDAEVEYGSKTHLTDSLMEAKVPRRTWITEVQR